MKNMCDKNDNNQTKKHVHYLDCIICIFIIVLYTIFHFVMLKFHEPWYDEAVAWQIAKCASIKDILLSIPHYEGHPPLWTMILVPFAKFGAPYELSLSIVSYLFSVISVVLIVWKAPFPKWFRYSLPFSYFIFYQYGVISRPYCITLLAFVLLSMFYQERNEKPFRYVLAMILLCLTSAFGFLASIGLALVWTFQIVYKRNIKEIFRSVRTDKRVHALFFLLAVGVTIGLLILPTGDTYVLSGISSGNNPLLCLMYMLICQPSDLFISNAYYTDTEILKTVIFESGSLVATAVGGVVVWLVAGWLAWKKKTIGELVVPYVLMGCFGAFVYMAPHHQGVFYFLFLFWGWISWQKDKDKLFTKKWEIDSEKSLKFVGVVIFAAICVVSLYWSAASTIQDINKVYAAGRYEYRFITENHLDDYNIMAEWRILKDSDVIISENPNNLSISDNVNAYADHNLFFNMNFGQDDVAYSTHIFPSPEEVPEIYSKWEQTAKPDVLYMTPELEKVYEDVSMADYRLVYVRQEGSIWKGVQTPYLTKIYVETDLAKRLGLEEVEDPIFPEF